MDRFRLAAAGIAGIALLLSSCDGTNSEVARQGTANSSVPAGNAPGTARPAGSARPSGSHGAGATAPLSEAGSARSEEGGSTTPGQPAVISESPVPRAAGPGSKQPTRPGTSAEQPAAGQAESSDIAPVERLPAAARTPDAQAGSSQGSTPAARAQPEEPELSLVEEDRTYIWDLEHHSNILVSHGFKALGVALARQDPDAVRAILADPLEGQVFESPTEIGSQDAVLTARRSWQAATRALDREGMVAYLLEHRRAFRTEPKVRFDVKLISPEARENLDGPWTALCAMRMWGDAEAEPGELSIVFRARFARPTKERMGEPAWLMGIAVQQVTNTRASRFLFRDVTDRYGIDTYRLHDNWKAAEKKHNTGALYACDYNRDSCPDLLVTDGPHTIVLLRGRPEGGFDDVTRPTGLAAAGKMPVHCVHAAIVDLDGDGWEDIVFSRGDIWRNEQGQQFVNVMSESNFYEASGGGTPLQRGEMAAITVADYDRDGRVDLYLHRSSGTPNSWLEDTFDSPTRNILLRNLGDWQFENATASSGLDGGGRVAFTTVWFDANNDLWPDLYVINEFGDGALYVNQQDGTFTERDVDPSTADFGSMGVTSGDIDNDGWIDLYLASMYSKAGSRIIGNMPPGLYPDDVMFKLRRLISGSEFYQNEGGLKFSGRAEEYQLNSVGWAYGPTLADFNNDGLLDAYAPAGYISRDRDKPDG